MPYKHLYTSDLQGEMWAPIKGYPFYEISNKGRVKALPKRIRMPNTGYLNRPAITMSPGINNNDYLYVNLNDESGAKKTITVHRLVALHFVENSKPNIFKIIRHLDNDKSNNNASNLGWCNHSINNKQAWDDGLKSKQHLSKKGAQSHSAKPVDQFTKDGQFIKRHLSRVEAANELGIGFSQINNVVSGRGKTAHGFIWRAVE